MKSIQSAGSQWRTAFKEVGKWNFRMGRSARLLLDKLRPKTY